MSERAYTIQNVGGIEEATLTLRPGVNCLRGRNACGKTSSFNAISRAHGADVEIERRDGTDHGEIRGPGVRLRVGKVVRSSGEAELALADVAPLSTLIDPGFKDPDANARARIRALIELLHVRADEAALEILCQKDELLIAWLQDELQAACTDDLVLAAEKLRHHVHGLAREEESKADGAEGSAKAAAERSAALLEALGGQDQLAGESVEQARTALVEGSRTYERAVAQCEAREALEAQQADLRATFGERPDPEAAERELVDARAELQNVEDEIASLERKLASARERRAAHAADVEAKQERVSDLVEAAKRWDAVQAQTATGPTREELAQLHEEHVTRMEARLDRAQKSADYHASEAERQEAQESARRARKEAERLRALGKTVPNRLGDVLAQAGAGGLTVLNGRLHALQNGQTLDFERRLSEGQRTRIALDLAAQAYEPDDVVPLAGEFWTSLDPQNQAEWGRLTTERGLFVLTEQPAEGELRVEHVGDDAGAAAFD